MMSCKRVNTGKLKRNRIFQSLNKAVFPLPLSFYLVFHFIQSDMLSWIALRFFFYHSLNVLIIPILYSQNTADLFSLSLAAKYLNSFIYSCIAYSLLDKLNKGQTFTSPVSLSKIQAEDLTSTNHIHMPYFE